MASVIAKILNKILKMTKPKFMDSDEEVNKFLAEKSEETPQPVKSIFKREELNGRQVFTFGDEKSENAIVYIHGGAFVNEMNMQHLLYCKLMSSRLDAYVIAPVYPLAPLHHADETFDLITELYEELLSKNYNITLMGDSAGGGFVLSFCQYLNEIDLPQPRNTITFSPWVDVSMSNTPYDSENDSILGDVGLREIGKSWAGDWDVKDYRVSPIYGNNDNLARSLIFAGDAEIFYKDIKKYVDSLKDSDVDTGPDLFHIYPLFPIPEASSAFKEIKNEMK